MSLSYDIRHSPFLGRARRFSGGGGIMGLPLSISTIFTSQGAVTVQNSVTETSLFDSGSPGSSRTILANTARVGQFYRVVLDIFSLTTTLNPTARIRAKLGTNLLADTGAFAFPTANLNTAGRITCDIWVNSIGAVGNAFAVPLWFQYVDSTSGVGEGAVRSMYKANFSGVNFTIDEPIDITWQWGTASLSNLVEAMSTIEVLG